MPTPTITDKALIIMEEFLRLAPEACNELIGTRVKVTRELADSASIQVSVGAQSQFRVGVLGLVNGILEAGGNPRIAVCLDNDKVVGFTKYSPPAKPEEKT